MAATATSGYCCIEPPKVFSEGNFHTLPLQKALDPVIKLLQSAPTADADFRASVIDFAA